MGMKLRIAGAALVPLLALLSAPAAHADDYAVLKTMAHRTVVVANLTTIERSEGEVRVDVIVFPQSGSADMLRAAAIVGCGRNIMHSQHTMYYDLTIVAGRLQSARQTREEISDFDGNTGTMYGLDNTVYDTLMPLCAGTPAGARRINGDEASVVAELAPEFVR
jgi:hypothetical protein